MKINPLKTIWPLIIAVFSMIFYYLALPPLNLWFFAFLPPIFWFFIIVMKKPDGPLVDIPSSKGFFRRFVRTVRRFFRSFYGQLYAASLLFWGVSLSWLPLPHPAIWFGWVGLTALMASYFLLFIWGARTFVHRFHFPLFLAPAVAWVGAEWIRKHFLGGFSFSSLEHAFYQKPTLIQTAEIMGEYGVGALIVLIGTAVAIAFDRLFFTRNGKGRILTILASLCWVGILLGFMIGYGHFALRRVQSVMTAASKAEGARSLRIALLQDPTYYQFPVGLETNRLIHQRYLSLSHKAAQNAPLDLIVWPEGTFAYPFYEFKQNAPFPTEDGTRLAPDKEWEEITRIQKSQERMFGDWVKSLGCPVLVGLTSVVFDPDTTRTYNSALYWAEDRSYRRYDKRARVMFGEYIPFVEYLPDDFPLKTLCEPIAPGQSIGIIPVDGRYSALVSICFESSLPRFVKSQIIPLEAKGIFIDFLINISNDAWFFGGVENDLHAATYPFRAVETRKFYLEATHGGVSRAFDPGGRVIASGKKGETGVVMAEFIPLKMGAIWNGRGLYLGMICAILFGMALLSNLLRLRPPTSTK